MNENIQEEHVILIFQNSTFAPPCYYNFMLIFFSKISLSIVTVFY